jgi:hypothetical protein
VSAILTIAAAGAAGAVYHFHRRERQPVAPSGAVASAYRELLDALAELSSAVFRVIYHSHQSAPWPKDVRDELERKHNAVVCWESACGFLLAEPVLKALKPITARKTGWTGMQELQQAISLAHETVRRQGLQAA